MTKPIPQPEDNLVATVDRSPYEQIQVALRSFKNVRYADLRIWRVGAKGAVTPTFKGINFTPDRLDAVIAGLEKLRAAARKEGFDTAGGRK